MNKNEYNFHVIKMLIVGLNGGTGHSYQAGSGSGGTVHITTATLSGTGLIHANGGAHEVGGGGGRIAVYYGTLEILTDQIIAKSGAGSYADGQDGTVHLEQQ